MKNTLKTPGLIIILSLISFISCIKKPADPPVVTTTPVTEVSYTAAISGGNVTSEGGGPVTGRGVCRDTSANPEIMINGYTIESGTLGTYESVLVELSPNTTYYVRAYANNATGTGYGDDMSFTTKEYGSVADVDGNVYKTADIGSQVWMAENLKTTKYQNGDLIGTTTPITLDISDQVTPKYQWDNYNGTVSDVQTYGKLYTWYTVTDDRGICPTGWHVPSDVELEELITYLGGDIEAGGKLKEAVWSHWLPSSIYGTNESGFSALPGADRDIYGSFQLNGSKSKYWTSMELDLAQSLYWYLSYEDNSVSSDYTDKGSGLSIRCIKDN
jgi:uncharacterized protein (TIGR02145 family)